MKKNYNHAHDNLMKSWSSSTKELSKLAEMRETGLTETLGKFEFTHACLERLENVITQLEEADAAEELEHEEFLSSQLSDQPSGLSDQPSGLKPQVALGSVSEIALDHSEMQRKMTCFMLERMRHDFGWIYRDVKSDLTQICYKNEIEEFKKLLLESPWMKGVLAEIGKELSIYALSESDSKKRGFEMFDLIASKDSNFSQYKFEILKTLSKESVIEFLLSSAANKYYSPSEVSHVLSKSHYEGAVGLFEKVIIEGVGRTQLAQYCKGEYLQYAGDSKGATGAFQSAMEGDASVKEDAQERLASLDSIPAKQRIEELAAKLKGVANSYLKEYEAVISDALGKVCDSLTPSSPNEPAVIIGVSMVQPPSSPSKLAEAVEGAKKVLSKIKFINLKQDAPPEIVSAQEFRDLPKIYSSLVSKLDKAEKEKLVEYCAAVEHIEEAIKVVGETETGFDVLGA